MDNEPVKAPMEFMRPLFRTRYDLNEAAERLISELTIRDEIAEDTSDRNGEWLWNAVKVVQRETRFDKEGRKVRITAQNKKDAKAVRKEYKWLDEVSEAYNRWDAHVVQFLVDTQVLDKATAKKWTANADYFPFYRVLTGDEEVSAKGPQIFKGMHPFGKNIFLRAKGSETQKTLDPTTAIAMNLRAAIILGMKNHAANRVVRNMIDAGQAQQVQLNAKGSVVKTRVGGKNKAFRVEDKALFEAFQNFSEGGQSLPPGWGLVSAPKRVISESITRVPVFWAKQIIRDGLSAGSLLGTGVWSTVFRSAGNAAILSTGKLLASVPGISQESVLPESYIKLKNAGVITRYDQVITDYDTANQVIRDSYREAGIRNLKSIEGIKGLPMDILMGIWNVLGQGTIVTDASTRMVVYDHVLKQTGDEAEAIFQAMEILNFTRRGKSRIVQLLSTLIPFQNPRWQGLDVFARAYTGTYGLKGKKGERGTTASERRKAVWYRTAMFMSLTPIYYMLVKDTDEYKEMSDEERQMYWLIPGFKELLGYSLRVPKPFELGFIFSTIPEYLMRVMDGRETWKDVRDMMWRQSSETLKLFPWEAQVTKPAIEVVMKHNFFTGEPIVPDRPNYPTDPKLQRRASTPNAYVEVGEALNMSPLEVQHIWEGYTGPYGAYVATVADSLITNYVNPEAPTMPATGWEKSLFVGGLVHPPESGGLVNDFYKLREEVEGFIANSKAMERNLEVGDKRTYHYDDLYQIGYMDIVKDLKKVLDEIATAEEDNPNIALSDITKGIQFVTNNNDLTPEEKREKILDLKATRNDILHSIDIRKLRVALDEGLFGEIKKQVEELNESREIRP